MIRQSCISATESHRNYYLNKNLLKVHSKYTFAAIYLFKVNNGQIRRITEISTKLATKTTERCY